MVSEKPRECIGCALYARGTGFAHPAGPRDASICFVGEALGRTEAQRSQPFVGEAGVYLNRAYSRLGLDRTQFRIGNVVSCQPPNDWLSGAPWEHDAIRHCAVHRRKFDRHTVYVTLGVTATRTMLRELLGIEYYGKLDNWHGYVLGDGPYVIPTYHPAYLLRGNHKLFGAFLHDIRRAMEVASFGIRREPVDLVVDPDVQWFSEYCSSVPDDAWLAVDIETPIKGTDEDDTVTIDTSQIIRINFASNPQQGVTVPWDAKYLFGIRRLLESDCTKVFWNERFDVPILTKHGYKPNGTILDGMWAWHMLQSDLPKGLGFVTPFYSTLPPWKHKALTDPGEYAAQDAVAQLVNMMGIAKHLTQQGQWAAFCKYAVLLDSRVLHPAESQGILLAISQLQELQSDIIARRKQVEQEIAAAVPEAVLPWAGGWKRKPDESKYPNAVLRKVTERVLVCTNCEATSVGPSHKCKKEQA